MPVQMKRAIGEHWTWEPDTVALPSMGSADGNGSGLSTKLFATSTVKWQKSGKYLKSLLTHAVAISQINVPLPVPVFSQRQTDFGNCNNMSP